MKRLFFSNAKQREPCWEIPWEIPFSIPFFLSRCEPAVMKVRKSIGERTLTFMTPVCRLIVEPNSCKSSVAKSCQKRSWDGTNKRKISKEKCREKVFRRKEKKRILFLGLTCVEKNFFLTPLLSTLPLVRVFSFSVCHPIDRYQPGSIQWTLQST